MRADEDDDGRTSAFRCLDVARYTVAAVMTVLIVTVVVISLKVVLHPESLRLSVVGGALYSTRQPASEAVALQLNLRAENPSCRTRMSFLNVTAYLFDGATLASTSNPDNDCIIFFILKDKVVPPQMPVDWMTSVNATKDPAIVNQTYFELLYTERAVVEYMTLRVDGSLVTEVSSELNMTHLITYYCWPLLVGEANGRNNDVLCMDHYLGSK